MDKKLRTRIASLLVISALAMIMVSRTPGFESIRAVQFLLIFASGMCAGVALGVFRFLRKI